MCIRDRSWLLEQLEGVAKDAGRFAMFDIKEALEHIRIARQDNCFDVTVAAYLLNPLKSNYTYEDVAREQLNLIIEDKLDAWTKACYEAYTAYAASGILWKRLKECLMDRLLDVYKRQTAMGYNYNGKLKSAELLLKEDGTVQLLRRAQPPADYFAPFDCFDVGTKLLAE